jgi:hypothetical protein
VCQKRDVNKRAREIGLVLIIGHAALWQLCFEKAIEKTIVTNFIITGLVGGGGGRRRSEKKKNATIPRKNITAAPPPSPSSKIVAGSKKLKIISNLTQLVDCHWLILVASKNHLPQDHFAETFANILGAMLDKSHQSVEIFDNHATKVKFISCTILEAFKSKYNLVAMASEKMNCKSQSFSINFCILIDIQTGTLNAHSIFQSSAGRMFNPWNEDKRDALILSTSSIF